MLNKSEIQIVKNLFFEKLKLNNSKKLICLFIGAGADISAGGMTFAKLKLACLQEFKPNITTSLLDVETIDRIFNHFFMEECPESQRAAVIDYLFHGMEEIKPSDAYKFLVLLGKNGIINCIITTNFDNMLEKAQQLLGMNVFQIYTPGLAEPYLINKSIILPEAPLYIKLHGDIQSKVITHITDREIKTRKYSKGISLLLKHIFKTHILVFIGYGGNDEVFAQEISNSIKALLDPVFWCNISPLKPSAPLYDVIKHKNIFFIESSFDNLIINSSVQCLSNIESTLVKLNFIEPLINERIESANRQFIEAYTFPSALDRMQLLIPRENMIERIISFYSNTEKPLAIISGKSGTGKTTLLVQYYEAMKNDNYPTILLLSARSFSGHNIVELLLMHLGYVSESPLATIYEFSTWLYHNNKQLVVSIDGLNEFHPNIHECLLLFREIISVSMWLQKHNAIKFLITLRSETWNELYSLIELSDLKKVLWNNNSIEDEIKTIYLDKYSNQELMKAYSSYSRYYNNNVPFQRLSISNKELFSDPFLLSLSMQCKKDIEIYPMSYITFYNAINEIIIRSMGKTKSQTVEIALSHLAFIGLQEKIDKFNLSMIHKAGLETEDIRILKEIKILSYLGDDCFLFTHDRIHEVYLAKSLNLYGPFQIRNIEDIKYALELSCSYPRLRSALKQHFVSPTEDKIEYIYSLIFSALRTMCVGDFFTNGSDYRLLAFIKETIIEIAQERPQKYYEIVNNFILQGNHLDSSSKFIIQLIQICRHSNTNHTIKLLALATKSKSQLIRSEAVILIYDVLSEYILTQNIDNCDILFTEPLSEYFDLNENALDCAIKIIGILFYIGYDNTNAEEWKKLSKMITVSLKRILKPYILSNDDVTDIVHTLISNANRYLFNSNKDVIERYYMSDNRSDLRSVFNSLKRGNALSSKELQIIIPKITLNDPIIFIICNLFFILSMKNSKNSTLQLFDTLYKGLNSDTDPIKLDFFLSALSTSHLAIGLACQDIISSYTKKMIVDFPEAMLSNPGAIRGQMRARFLDPFDQQFEDGFNPLAFYFYNAPSEKRKSLFYQEYKEHMPFKADMLPLYWQYLELYEQNSKINGITRVVHALGQMIALWPIEGLSIIQKLIGRTEPIIRRAILRVLAESYARNPKETSILIERSGDVFNEEELNQIRCCINARLSERSIEQLQWSRVIFFLDQLDSSGKVVLNLTDDLLNSYSFPEAIRRILQHLVIDIIRIL